MDLLEGRLNLWGMYINRAKSEVLTNDPEVKEIRGIECKESVKYLGVRLSFDKNVILDQWKKNAKRLKDVLKWKLWAVTEKVKQTCITTMLRAKLFYGAVPLYLGGVIKQKDVDTAYRTMFKEIIGLPKSAGMEDT